MTTLNRMNLKIERVTKSAETKREHRKNKFYKTIIFEKIKNSKVWSMK